MCDEAVAHGCPYLLRSRRRSTDDDLRGRTVTQQTVDVDLNAIADRVIGRRAIDESLERLRRTSPDAVAGLFGPESMLWRMLEPLPVLPLMLVQAGLLELATPKIFFGTEYSITRSGDYNSRFARSYEAFTDWFLGDVDTALKTARRVHGYHTRVGGHAPQTLGRTRQGQYYRATEQDLLIFTVGTQIVPIKQLYEVLVRPLTAAEVERFYDEAKRFSTLFGIDVAAMPATWSTFDDYWQGFLASGELELASDGLNRMGPFVDPSQLPFTTRTAVKLVMTLQFNLLPENLQRQYAAKLPLAKARPRTARLIGRSMKIALRVLPRSVTSAPRVLDAHRRVGTIGPPTRGEERVRTALPYPFGDKLPSMCTPASPDADPRHSNALTQPPVP
jgi:uncharacterized protein (DUF2236 family)